MPICESWFFWDFCLTNSSTGNAIFFCVIVNYLSTIQGVYGFRSPQLCGLINSMNWEVHEMLSQCGSLWSRSVLTVSNSLEIRMTGFPKWTLFDVIPFQRLSRQSWCKAVKSIDRFLLANYKNLNTSSVK